jgi:hypothetical protein
MFALSIALLQKHSELTCAGNAQHQSSRCSTKCLPMFCVVSCSCLSLLLPRQHTRTYTPHLLLRVLQITAMARRSALFLSAAVALVLVAVAVAQEVVPSTTRKSVSDVCAFSSSACRSFPSTTARSWQSPNVLDASWIPDRWCLSSSNTCASGRSYTPYTTVLNNVAVGRMGVVFDSQHMIADPLVINGESWDFPTFVGDDESASKFIQKAAHIVTYVAATGKSIDR